MQRFRRSSLSRASGVCVLIAAWFAVSNHCALALLERGTTAAVVAEVHQCCAAQSSADDEQPAPSRTTGICCKSLRLLPLESAAKLVKGPELISLFVIEWIAFVDQRGTEPGALETKSRAGPPRASSFAEIVLQRSLPANAPPLAA